ncbi:uncharacterized protein LOC121589772 isoform X5 [Anopheles merus]|uniref:uncharacterized protein LOC121589772 isoform X5 n=1 Tax=Anopheles merus TaxID=30066 RepID=UPI001BE4DE5A|nr:uncharacterized protein LOC121589772 isoform X5 [Anopheles merus]
MQLVQIVTVFSCIVLQLQSVAGLKYRAEPNVVPIVPASAFGNELEAGRSAPKSPLLEIVLRILDSIQIVPKKRSRRRARSYIPASGDVRLSATATAVFRQFNFRRTGGETTDGTIARI